MTIKKAEFRMIPNETEAPLISIVTITYNASAEIIPTLKSVTEQTCDDFEYLVIDGASRDDTLELVRRHGPSGARILSEPDRGLYDAMNKGLHLARGKYVLFLNAGDAFHDADTLGAYAAAAEGGADIIYGDTVIVDAAREFVAPRHLSAPERLTVESFSHGMLICHQAFMVRRSLAPDYDLSYRFSADYDWTVKCIKGGDPERFVNLHRVTVDYLSDGLTDKNMKASLKERYEIMGKHYGKMTAFRRHIGFIPRFLVRKLRR